ncbi:MAG: preprotein translocase subunit SecA [Tissierellales bacterium]|nr:preprotein translocase subunit SecA [Tissierellales bacterium]
MKKLFEKIFGTYSHREIKRIEPIVQQIESYEEDMRNLADDALREKTQEFKDRYSKGESLDDILPEAYAVVREAADRVLGIRHYRVQLIGGIILHQGNIAEMKTGEGKTLSETLPVYLNAVSGKGVHVVTVNDYLAKRDMEWMGKIYRFLGLTVGHIEHDQPKEERRAAYLADITYGTNNEFGFDYLRDNMVIFKEEKVQRELNYAIVDEVDSILIDEARTPLIISGQGEKSTDLYIRADQFVKTLKGRIVSEEEQQVDRFQREFKEESMDFTVDEKAKSATLSDKGVEKAENWFSVENLADADNMQLSHHINQALKANNLMKLDIDYVIKDGEIVIVDEFTGRLMFGRRYSDGLHQAIEAKEGIEVRRESKTLATITFQNYFRMYEKLAGMTGTAMTEEDEFREIYTMDSIAVPTNRPIARIDAPDIIYKNEVGKFRAVINEVKESYEKKQPVLVGTISIETSEMLSRELKKAGVKHQVLNAKQHDREAEIVAQAGRLGAVTIATNMAGRGTDIKLGGNADFMAKKKLKSQGASDHLIALCDGHGPTDDPEVIDVRERYNKYLTEIQAEIKDEVEAVLAAGGLRIIGTERHESRRIDNQLRGRAGRQGDPGASRFYISLEDDLMRLFGGDRVRSMVDSLGLPEDEPLEHGILSKSIEGAQRKVEGRNFGIRKHVLQYDDVMNKQREVIYAERAKVLEGENLRGHIISMLGNIVDEAVERYTAGGAFPEEWDLDGLEKYLHDVFIPMGLIFEHDNILLPPPLKPAFRKADIDELTKEELSETLKNVGQMLYETRERLVGDDRFREIERIIMLKIVDTKWIDHIDAMDQLKQGIGLRAMGNEDPVRAYQKEGYDMFEELIHTIQVDTVKYLFHIEIETEQNIQREKVAKESGASHGGESSAKKTIRRTGDKIGRNDLCPCGSGKKYKKCCGKEA